MGCFGYFLVVLFFVFFWVGLAKAMFICIVVSVNYGVYHSVAERIPEVGKRLGRNFLLFLFILHTMGIGSFLTLN